MRESINPAQHQWTTFCSTKQAATDTQIPTPNQPPRTHSSLGCRTQVESDISSLTSLNKSIHYSVIWQKEKDGNRQATGDIFRWLVFLFCPAGLLCKVLTGIPRAFRIFILHIGQVRWSSSQGSTQDLWKRCLQWKPGYLNSNAPQHHLPLSTRWFWTPLSEGIWTGAVCDLCKDCRTSSCAHKAKMIPAATQALVHISMCLEWKTYTFRDLEKIYKIHQQTPYSLNVEVCQ